MELRVRTTAKNTVISPNVMVWKFCGKAQFLHSFDEIAVLFAVNQAWLSVLQAHIYTPVKNLNGTIFVCLFFFCQGFLSRTLTIQRTA